MRSIYNFVFIIFFIFLSFKVFADQNDPRLNHLFEKLNKTDDQDEINDLISNIWDIWYQVDDPKVIEYFEKGIQAMNIRNYPLAIRFFNNLIYIIIKNVLIKTTVNFINKPINTKPSTIINTKHHTVRERL